MIKENETGRTRENRKEVLKEEKGLKGKEIIRLHVTGRNEGKFARPEGTSYLTKRFYI